MNDADWKRLSKKQGVFLHEEHGRPNNRRDFLAAGIVSFSASLAPINLLSLLFPSRADAATASPCVIDNPVQTQPLPPFISLNLTGGAAMMANFLPNDREGGVGGSFNTIDWSRQGTGPNPGANPMLEFGNVPFFGGVNGVIPGSQILAGIRSKASATTLANTAFVGMPARSGSDTDQNPHDLSGLVIKAGRLNRLLPIFANNGSNIAATGLAQLAALGVNPPTPSVVSDARQIFSALGSTPTGANDEIEGLSSGQKITLFNTLSKLTGDQLGALLNTSPRVVMNDLLSCATRTNASIVGNAAATNLDPRADAAMAAAFGLTATSSTGSQDVVFATIVKTVIDGLSGCGSLQMGGYDYHDGTRSSGNSRDFDAGEVIGQVLESAARKGSPLFLYVTSDGSIDSSSGSDNYREQFGWSGDRNETAGVYLLAYSPSARPATKGWQINKINADGSAFAGGVIVSPERAAVSALANYLQFSGQITSFGVVTNNALDATQLARILMFA